MKRTASIILLSASYLVLIASVMFCMHSICDISRTLHDLAKDPSASGMDYWGIGWGAGICLFVLSVLGSVLSGLSMKLLRQSMLRYVSAAALAVYGLLFAASLFLFFM